MKSSFELIQLQDDLPGFTKEPSIEIDGAARSVPKVDSTIVCKLPIAIMRQGEANGNEEAGNKPLPVMISLGSGKARLYSPLGAWACNLLAQYFPSISASVI